jgi:hypothetical protein
MQNYNPVPSLVSEWTHNLKQFHKLEPYTRYLTVVTEDKDLLEALKLINPESIGVEAIYQRGKGKALVAAEAKDSCREYHPYLYMFHN